MLKQLLKVGDRVRESYGKSTNISIGTIISIRRPASQVWYQVEWDTDPGKYFGYQHSIVKDRWTKIESKENNKSEEEIKEELDNPMFTLQRPYDIPFEDLRGEVAIEYGGEFTVEHKGCQHDWADYQGFSESYQYCRKCDEKRNIN